jgi:hypothetical protein
MPSRTSLQTCWKIMGSLVKPATLAFVHISDDLSNGPHLEVNETVELRAGHTQVTSSCSETTFSASEGNFAHIDRQFGNLYTDPSCHRPAMSCNRFGTTRHRRPPALPAYGCMFGRVGQATSSLLYFAVCPK